MSEAEFAVKPEIIKPRNDVAIAFGQGPVIDSVTKKEAETIAKETGTSVAAEINSWGRTTAVAVGYLYSRGEFREIVWSGGKTGGADYPSEAKLMQDGEIQVFGSTIPAANNHVEESSTNTLANMENTYNEQTLLTDEALAKGLDRSFAKKVLVGSDFHISRIRTLGYLYGEDDFTLLSSEQVVKVMAQDGTVPFETIHKAARYMIPGYDPKTDPRHAILDWIDRRIFSVDSGLNRTPSGDFRSFVGGGKNIAERKKGFTYFEKAEEARPGGEESKDVVRRAFNEDMFSEGLLTMPANWLGFIADIKDEARFKKIIHRLESWSPGFCRVLGIEVSADMVLGLKTGELEQIRSRLRPYKTAPDRKFVSLVHEEYNSGTLTAAESLLDYMRAQRAPANA